jgi:hypothetical protein
MSETTPRLSLPLLQAGQAQKEALHNEALTVLDAIVSGTVESVGENVPPSVPLAGQAWIVGTAPSGDWAGQAGAVAIWTAGGWRCVPAREGMVFRHKTSGVRIERGTAAWSDGAITASSLVIDGHQIVGARLSGITEPSGGSTIDTEARTAVDAIIVALRTHGLISS